MPDEDIKQKLLKKADEARKDKALMEKLDRAYQSYKQHGGVELIEFIRQQERMAQSTPGDASQ